MTAICPISLNGRRNWLELDSHQSNNASSAGADLFFFRSGEELRAGAGKQHSE